MTDLVTWLRVQLDEDEKAARLADGSVRWRAERGQFGPEVHVSPDDDGWQREVNYPMWICDDEEDGCPEVARGWMAEARHIATHDPARVLAEVAAKRAILDEHAILAEGAEQYCRCCRPDRGYNAHGSPLPCPTVRLLALPYAMNPGYDESWRPA